VLYRKCRLRPKRVVGANGRPVPDKYHELEGVPTLDRSPTASAAERIDFFSAQGPESAGSNKIRNSALEGAKPLCAASSRLHRWLVPSLSDVFFVALFLWLFVVGRYGWQGLLFDGDIGWHIRTGEHILDRGAVPATDLFSFTRPGAPWFAWEWLSDVGFALAHRSAGLKGVVLVTSIILTSWAVLLLRQALWRGANAWVAMIVTLLGVSASAIHFMARPHIVTLLFATVSVWMIESDRRRAHWQLWLLIPLTALWANLHGGFVIGVALAGIAALGSAAELWAGVGDRRRVVRYATLSFGCCAASMLNPYGMRLHVHIFEFLRSGWIMNAVQEFQAPTFRSENQSQYELLLIVGLGLSGFLIARRRYVEVLWIIACAHLSLISVRNIPVYIAVVAPIVAEVLTTLWSAAATLMRRNSAPRILYDLGVSMVPGFRRMSVWTAAFLLAVSCCGPAANWPQDFPAVLFPTSLIRANKAKFINGRVMTVDQWADYLIYAFYPTQKVFVDGRSDFFGPELGGEYVRAIQGDYRWRKTLDRYGIDTVLAPVTWPLATLLKSGPEWQVVADDGQAILFTRR
jgi:hypothetical protein